MKRQVVFVHIQKTAGSSLLESLLKPNVDDHKRVNPRSYLLDGNAHCVSGHFPYGLHWCTQRPVKYVTMLRDPVDRAVSWYYFIKDLKRTDLWKPHPLREYAESVTLVEFYENPNYSNMQTRFLAGWHYHKAYPLLHRSSTFRQSMLRAAKKHLREHIVFGLQERFDDSISLLQDSMDWNRYEPVPPQAKTGERPTLKEINDLNPAVLPRLRELHTLDLQLYQYAVDLFEERRNEEVVPANGDLAYSL